jgi:trehalose/maltose hydrolase-like predicted phosphorylase
VELDPAGGVIEQFRGYFGLEPILAGSYVPHRVPLDVVLGAERTQRSQVVKQPDVVMLSALLPERIPETVRAASFDYYLARCGHGSSLSPSIHALVAARLGKLEDAERLFRASAEVDLEDTMGNSAGGVHIAALGGLWQAVVLGFAGVSGNERGLVIDPKLPSHWGRLRLPFRWRGCRARITLDPGGRDITVTLEVGNGLTVQVGDQQHVLKSRETWSTGWPGSIEVEDAEKAA